MSRYQRDFAGIPSRAEATGMDPNFQEGNPYGGMRMRGGRGRAAYGAHRWDREPDLETWGSFHGVHGPGRPFGGSRSRRPDPHPEWEISGGMRNPFTDERQQRDFDSRSRLPERSGPPPRYGRDLERREGGPIDRSWSPARGFRPGYSNRGVTDAGYSEGWARGPMRGAR
jgi:hypothetical protein